MPPLSEAHREIGWNIAMSWLMYPMAFLAVAIFAYGFYARIREWRKGRPAGERLTDLGPRVALALKEMFLQRRVLKSAYPAIFHSLIFFSFLALFFVTLMVMVDWDFGHFTGIYIFRGVFYAVLTVVADFAGAFVLVGVGMAAWRRWVTKPQTLDNTWEDAFALALIALLVLTGFLAEGLRIAVIGDPWALLSPFGLLASLPFVSMGDGAATLTHQVLWWTHTVLAMAFIALIPYTKLLHIFALPANIGVSNLRPPGELKRFDIEAVMMADDFDESKFAVGTQRMEELTWKQRLEFDACIRCGRCDEVCPSYAAGLPFSPKQFIQKMREQFAKDAVNPPKPAEGEEGPADPIVGRALDEEFIWHCRTCMACMEVCPAMIEHVPAMIEIRRNEVVMQGRLPTEAAQAMRMLEAQGNPFGPQDDRVDWVNQMGLRVLGEGEQADVLYWIGCCTTFDQTKREIATNILKLAKQVGIDVAVLGGDEQCCGDPARLIGQEHLFQTIAKASVEKLAARKFQYLLVSCPHCYNVLKHEYPQFGGNFNVVHHSEFLHEMVWAKKLKPVANTIGRAVYHDPCYLGRYQKIYDAPREVLKAIPGAKVVEMKTHHERSMCCGGGGGHFWMDIKKGERINNMRVKQAVDAGADTMVTACAYCNQMLTDSVKIMNVDDKIRVVDLATVLVEAMGEQGPEAKAK